MLSFLRTHSAFPKSLLDIKPTVKQIYLKGHRPSSYRTSGVRQSNRTITIVGSRKMTRYGQQVIEKLVPPLVSAGVTIVSGFMYGVDQYVHRVCLGCGGNTVAVLGWGIDWQVLPVERELYRQIEQKGLLLSEYPADTKPQLWMFPARDRLMAGLGQATLVIEAAKRSGSLITAGFAKRYKRKLFSVPGPITSTVSAGTNGLIKSGQALMTESAKDIFQVMNWPQVLAPRGCGRLSEGSGKSIVAVLENEALTLDELAQKTKQSVLQISAELSILQLQDVVSEENGQYFLKSNVNQN